MIISGFGSLLARSNSTGGPRAIANRRPHARGGGKAVPVTISKALVEGAYDPNHRLTSAARS